MKIGILTTGQAREDNRLQVAAEERGHEVTMLDLHKCSISVCPENPKIYYEGEKIMDAFDVIIPRINVSYTGYGLTILRQFQAIGVYTTDTAYAIELGRDKLRCLQHMLRRGVPFPTTGFARSRADFDRVIDTVGGVPLIIKLVEGTEGIGVFLAIDVKQAKNILKTFKQLDAAVLVQEFIAESSGTDIRCFVVGGRIVASMRRESQDGDFRANVSLGGHSHPVALTKEEKEIALNAAEAIGINISGVDIIRSKKGPVIIEINVSPDFSGPYGLEEVSGVDVADEIIRYAEAGKRRFDNGKGVWLKEAA